MKFRVSEWLDTSDDNAKTYPTVYGIQCNIGNGWQHVSEEGKVLFFDTAKSASEKIADLQTRYCANAEAHGRLSRTAQPIVGGSSNG